VNYIVNENKLFPCSIIEVTDGSFKEYKNDLVTYITNYSKNNSSVKKSNAGGYQSNSLFLQDPEFEPFFKKLIDMFKYTFNNYLGRTHAGSSPEYRMINGWININSTNNYNYFHCHGGSDVSSVFWVKANKNSGSLVFPNPYQYSQWHMLEEEHKVFEPKEGKLIFFPSSMNHFVTQNLSKTSRISLAFNFKAV